MEIYLIYYVVNSCRYLMSLRLSLCVSCDLYDPILLNPNNRIIMAGTWSFFTISSKDSYICIRSRDSVTWDSVTGTQSLGFSHWDSIIWTQSLGLSQWDSVTGTQSLGLSHLDSVTGTQSMGLSHWDSVIGTQSLALSHWHSVIMTQSLGLNN
jgi:hypothetical protein